MEAARLNEAIAEKVFGWKWMSYHGMPTRSHLDYPKETRVRRFFPHAAMAGDEWVAFSVRHEVAAADGSEPLAYCYCSSGGPAVVPNYSGDESDAATLEHELRERGLFGRYATKLMENADQFFEPDGKCRLTGPTCRDRCLAALAIVPVGTEKEAA